MEVLGLGAYVVPTCVDASSVPGGLAPRLDMDIGDKIARYETYGTDECEDGDVLETVDVYGYPHEEGAPRCSFTGVALRTRDDR